MTALLGLSIGLLIGLATAQAQGVNERMITGAPPPGSTIYVVPSPEPRRPTAVPTGPRPWMGGLGSVYPPPPPDYRPYRPQQRVIRPKQ